MPLESLKGFYYLDVTWVVKETLKGPLATSDPDGFRRGKPSNWGFRILNDKGTPRVKHITWPLSNDEIDEITKRSGMTLGRRHIIAFDGIQDATAVATLIEANYPSTGAGSVRVSVKPANSLPEFQIKRGK